MGNDEITVIVAVFNAEKELQNCLDSILKQSYRNLEIILVDDGSKDSSGQICDFYANKDQRVKVIHKENEGLSVARNIALTVATGEYVSFIDSDDILHHDLYMNSIEVFKKEEDLDIIKYDYCVVRDKLGDGDQNNLKVISGREFTKKVLTDEIGSQLWQYVFKRSLWDSLISPAGRLAQDMMVLHVVTSRAKKVGELKRNLYYYYQNNAKNVSNSNRKTIRGTVDRAFAYWIRVSFCEDEHEYDDVLEICLRKAVSYTVSCYCRSEFINEQRYKEDCILFRRKLIEYRKSKRYKSCIDVKRKLAVSIIIARPNLMPGFYSIIKR